MDVNEGSFDWLLLTNKGSRENSYAFINATSLIRYYVYSDIYVQRAIGDIIHICDRRDKARRDR